MNDFRFALRQLLKSPGFTLVAVLTLALGIGANTVVFGWINTVLVDTVPGAKEANRLVVLCPRDASGRLTDTMSFPDNVDLSTDTNTFAGVIGSSYDTVTLRVGAEISWVWAESATANYFEVLGIKPELGRLFLPDEDSKPGGNPVVILSHDLWRRRFAADPGVIGRTAEIGSRSFTIIGVAPASFQGTMGGLRFDLWLPVSMSPQFGFAERVLVKRAARFLHTYARLQPGITLDQAQGAASLVMKRLETGHPDSNREVGVAVLPVWKSPYGGQSRLLPLLQVLVFAAALLLLIVTANMANLLLARAVARRQEMSVRIALGAGMHRLLRQMLVESVTLSALGGLLGVLLASWCVGLLPRLLPATYLPVGYNLRLDWMTLALTAGVTLGAGLLFGLAPALHALKSNLASVLKEAGRGGDQGRQSHWLRGALVAAEVALAMVLLVGMALCGRSLNTAAKLDLGLDPANVWVAGFRLPPTGRFLEENGTQKLYERLRLALAEVAGVESSAIADWLPLGFEGGPGGRFAVNGYLPAPGEVPVARASTVSPGYFQTFRIPLLSGREFAEQDDDRAPRVAIINQFLADRYFSGRNPVGLKIKFWNNDLTIVGVARTGKYQSLNESPQPFIYLAQHQMGSSSMTAIVRAKGDPRAVGRAVEQAAAKVDPLLKPMAAMPMNQYVAASFAIPRMAAILLAALGTVALILCVAGLYAVMSYAVNQRTREIGIRMALGAKPLDVLHQFLGQGMRLAVVGLVVGVIGSIASARLLSALLVGAGTGDVVAYLGVAALMLAVALAASWFPARRATKVDPMVALRAE